MLAAGLDGIKKGARPPKPVNQNIYNLTAEESKKLKVGALPHNLDAALNALENDKVVCAALGEHITEAFLAEKRKEWDQYKMQVHQWEIDEYMETF